MQDDADIFNVDAASSSLLVRCAIDGPGTCESCSPGAMFDFTLPALFAQQDACTSAVCSHA